MHTKQEHEDLFIQCIEQHLGFSKYRPVAACIIYKCLRQWRSFQKEKTDIFERIIGTVAPFMGKEDKNDEIVYCLSNISTLLFLLQHVFKDSGASRCRRSRILTTTQMVQRIRGAHGESTVEAKFPALLFEEQLTVYFERLYCMLRDNFKKYISKLLGLCIQAPRISRLSNLPRWTTEAALPSAASQDISMDHWIGIVEKIQYFQHLLVSNNVPPFLVRKIFMQIFWFINVQLFNSLLLKRECCTFSNGEYVKAGSSKLEHWCYKATEKHAGLAWDELKHIRKGVEFLLMNEKPKKTLDEITHVMFPVLSLHQLYRISTMYWDDKYGTYSLSGDVIFQMRVWMTEDRTADVNGSYLLVDDDNLSTGFSVEDLYESMSEINIEDVEPPSLLRKNSGFSFLL